MNTIFRFTGLLFLAAFVITGCQQKAPEQEPVAIQETLFTELLPDQTTITFQNTVVQNGGNNVLNYPYYFNGGGVAVGDINNDGLEDVYFSGNQVSNKLYLNKGNFVFEDITERAGVAAMEGWKTGVTFTDINQDGWLDIYVCRSAMSDSTMRKNLLYINNGDLTFTEKADAFGVADKSYSTHAAFFDYDKDGDLDLLVLNHSLPQYGGFNSMLALHKKKKGAGFHSRLFQNNKGQFKDVTGKAGLINNVLSFGLGIAISDINLDGWPDIYLSNDFNEEDYLYLNNKNGTFKNVIATATGHVSLFSMGSDVADINNDALPDIFTLDMLPESNERIKLSSGDDNYDKYKVLMDAGFHHQSMRNMLQLNNGDETFSEVGQLMGISNTDWSWATMFADFDNDGWKDLFVSNGYEKDYTNMQFLKFTVDEKLKARQTGAQLDLQQIINQMPAIEVGNFLFRNNGDLTFSKTTYEWGITRTFKSNGAATADFDNDGDLDLMINAINEKAIVYRNNETERSKANFLKIDFHKANPSHVVVGAKAFVYTAGKTQYQEFSPVRGFESSMYVPLIFGLGEHTMADSVRIIWPDNKTQSIVNVQGKSTLNPKYEEATQTYSYKKTVAPLFNANRALTWTHLVVDTNDFKRQLLLPKMYSYTGPRMAKGDVNDDGLEDVFICGPKHQPGAVFIQKQNGSFEQKKSASLLSDAEYQDEDATLFDADNDGDLDLYVVSGGYFFGDKDPLLQDRLYLNDGQGNFKRVASALPAETLAGSCVVALDVDNDKDLDLFVGTRLIPGSYPLSAPSMILVNDGSGNFKNGTATVSPALENIGMTCDAISADLNKDGAADLIVVGEWMPVKIFLNKSGKLEDVSAFWLPTATSGWYNCIAGADLDGDGDGDFIVGNYGVNNQYHVSAKTPATLVYKDFNQDGQVDPFFCYYINGQTYPYASRDEALGQVGSLRARFPDYTTYANATLDKIFKPQELEGAVTLRADQLKTIMLINNGGKFEVKELPIEAQFSPVHALAIADVDHDGDLDVLMGGNETMVRVRIGKSDANKGALLINDGKAGFTYLPQPRSGFDLRGDVRELLFISGKEKEQLLVGEIGQPIRSFILRKD